MRNDVPVFVIGNGPSLTGFDLKRLDNWPTVGMNAAYRYWYDINWRPRYYACCDLIVGLSHADAIADLIAEGRIERFLLRANLIESLGARAATPAVVNFDAIRPSEPFLAVGPATTGSHAALWMAATGAKTLVILGVDVQYQEIVDGAERRDGIVLEIARRANNPNYFFNDYQLPGDRYNLPNPRPGLHISGWREAAIELHRARVRTLNANPRSAVRYFPFIDIDEFLDTAPVGHGW